MAHTSLNRSSRCLALVVGLALLCAAYGAQAAERELHWAALDVEAHLDAVPEPAAIGLVALAAPVLVRRRRK